MNNFVVRLTLVCVLAGLLVVPALAKQGTSKVSPAQRMELCIPNAAHGQIASHPIWLADGPDPVPWPKTPGKPGPKGVKLQKLVADGPDPVPWPKTPGKPGPKGVKLPKLVADGPDPVPWPKTPGKPAGLL